MKPPAIIRVTNPSWFPWDSPNSSTECPTVWKSQADLNVLVTLGDGIFRTSIHAGISFALGTAQ